VERDLRPLEQIERAVQERAKDISLEMSGPGKDKLRALIADEVARWSLDHRRGLRPYDLSDPELVAERAYRNLAGYGPLEPLLDDDDVWEVMVNAVLIMAGIGALMWVGFKTIWEDTEDNTKDKVSEIGE
jgi:pilus assembly protein CpaF